jgi:hypothetical protein
MTTREVLPRIAAVSAYGRSGLRLAWKGARAGTATTLEVGKLMTTKRLKAALAPGTFARVEIADWGSAVTWPNGAELSALVLWLAALDAAGRADVREFVAWRLDAGLTLDQAAEALDLSRRTVANYSDGRHPVPRTVLLAIRHLAAQAA